MPTSISDLSPVHAEIGRGLRKWANWFLLGSLLLLGIGWPGVAQAAGPGPIAEWIWSDPFPRANQTAYFRKSFEVRGPLRQAELRGLADDRMTVFVNGEAVAEMANAKLFSTVDVTAKLHAGRNTLAVHAHNAAGPAGLVVQLHLVFEDGKKGDVASDQSWRTSGTGPSDWPQPEFDDARWGRAASFGLLGVQPWGNPAGEVDDYNQWKQALGTGLASDPAALQVVPGFEVELLKSAAKEEGSWVSLTFDPRGRLIVGREGPGLLRLTLPSEKSAAIGVETINDTLQECRGLLYAFDSLYANANNSKGLYRLRDTDGDDRFDDVKLLLQTGGGVGHGRNDLALGPEGKIYLIHGNNVHLPAELDAAGSPLKHFAEDQLRPCFFDRFLFDAGVTVPAGHLLRTDPEGQRWELVAGGFRNPYGIDFNADGELFTYDADNEGDIGTPWYRPTRVNHIVSGGDYGFRQGTANRPGFYPEHPPTNLEAGLGSPTAVKFGTHSRFPERYRRALFILDWAYGRILAIHLNPQGASYVCGAEKFLEGRPLNVTDLEFGPDGAMYFVTGGRGTQSGLYRVRSVGPPEIGTPESSADAAARERASQARTLRRKLEAFHGRPDSKAIELAWPHLDHPDPWIRHAARVAIEHQPPEVWQERAFAETRPIARWLALLALARVGPRELQPRLLARLAEAPLAELPPEQQLTVLRGYAVSFVRMGRPVATEAEKILAQLDPLSPAPTEEVDQRLGDLLAALESPNLVRKTIPRLSSGRSQANRLWSLLALRNVKTGWTLADRQLYFAGLREANQFEGGNLLPISVNAIRDEALAWLTDAERTDLAPLLAAEVDDDPSATKLEARPFVREWKLDDLRDALETPGKGRDFERGRALYSAALCNRCHRLDGKGAAVGPELTAVGNRFNRRDLLESILVPSKAIDEKYRNALIETERGQVVVGRIVGGDDQTFVIATDPLKPGQVQRVVKSNIASQAASPISPMPAGLLNTLTPEEILDLLAYLQSGGNRQHPVFGNPP
jgi:putative heme-binding domain-containing protein